MTGGPRHMTGLPKNILSSYKYITSGTFYLFMDILMSLNYQNET
jgi:hypothetical protein